MRQSTYEQILKWGAVASLVSFFIVDKSLYFPFITGKQLFFNILMEALAVVWLAYIVKFPQFRPKQSWITWALVAFFASLLLSSIFGIDFNLSFWGDAERMLGWFQIIHLFILYLVVITVFRSESDWLWLFVASICSAVGLVLYSLVTAEGGKSVGNVNMTSNISTLGNATYVAGVMIFNFFFAWYLFFKSRDWTMRFVLAVAILVILIGFFYADVSGSQAGWAIGIAVTLVIAGAVNKNRQIKIRTWSAVAVFIIVVALLFSFRDASVFDGNKMGKVLRDFNANNTTLRTRTYAWRSAWLGWQANPILGNGYGNFADHFDRYFVGRFYQWGTNEEYFDRAHNNLLDILSTAGLLSLLSYLSIFVALAYYLLRGARQGYISTLEVSTMTGVFVGYFIHNLAVFDALANYILLFFSLAFVYYLTNRTQLTPELILNRRIDKRAKSDWTGPELNAWVGAGIIALFLIYNYNVQVWQMFASSVRAASAWANVEDPKVAWKLYQHAMSYQTPLDRDCRLLWSSGITANPSKLDKLSVTERREAVDYAVELINQNLQYNPNDSLTLATLSRLQIVAYQVTHSAKYLQDANDSIDRSIASGGEHIPPYIIKGNLDLARSDWAGARNTFSKAKSYFADYPELDCYLAKLDFLEKKVNDETYQLLDKCWPNERAQQIIGVGDYLPTMAKYYQDKQDYQHLAPILELQLSADKTNPALWDKLYQAYLLSGDKEKAEAVREAQRTIK